MWRKLQKFQQPGLQIHNGPIVAEQNFSSEIRNRYTQIIGANSSGSESDHTLVMLKDEWNKDEGGGFFYQTSGENSKLEAKVEKLEQNLEIFKM